MEPVDIIVNVRACTDHIFINTYASLSTDPLPITVSLGGRQTPSDLLFLYKLLYGLISCPGLLASISFHVPKKATRLNYPLNTAGALSRRSTLQRLQRLYNFHSGKLDIL